METLELLGVALGLAGLAGINLYLTVFATGLAVRLGWLTLAPEFEALSILGDPVILTISGIFFLAEFFADKVPWVDSAWDSVHTFIRPVGAAFLAITVLGDAHPVFDVVIGLLAGGVALSTHAAKAGSRLLINASPEPFTNIGASLAGDSLVLAGLSLTFWNPVVALVVVILAVAAIFFFGPRIWRAGRARIHFAWRKLTAPALRKNDKPAKVPVPVALDCELHQIHPGDLRITACHPATTGQVPGLPSNIRGHLVVTADHFIYFGGRTWGRIKARPVELRGLKTAYERGFLFDRLTFYSPTTNQRTVFFIDRASREEVEPWANSLGGVFDPAALEKETELQSV